MMAPKNKKMPIAVNPGVFRPDREIGPGAIIVPHLLNISESCNR